MKYNLPEDLRAFNPKISKKILRLIIRLVITEAACIFVSWLLKNYIPPDPTAKTIYYVVIGIAAVACVISIFFEKAPDITYAGTIEDVKVKAKTKSETPEKPTIETLYTVCSIELFVRSPDNAARWINAATYKSKDIEQNKIEKFKVGAEVFHLCGTKTSVIFPTDSDNTVTCAVCGTTNPKEEEKCSACGHTLIKSLTQIT